MKLYPGQMIIAGGMAIVCRRKTELFVYGPHKIKFYNNSEEIDDRIRMDQKDVQTDGDPGCIGDSTSGRADAAERTPGPTGDLERGDDLH